MDKAIEEMQKRSLDRGPSYDKCKREAVDWAISFTRDLVAANPDEEKQYKMAATLHVKDYLDDAFAVMSMQKKLNILQLDKRTKKDGFANTVLPALIFAKMFMEIEKLKLNEKWGE